MKTTRRSEAPSLISVLASHYKSLNEACADEELLRQYLGLLKFLRSPVAGFLYEQKARTQSSTQVELNGYKSFNASSLTMQEAQSILNDSSTPRKLLEQIAIERFGVPKGSMRQFSNRGLLVEKLATLIRNERAHSTIGELAREGRST